MGAQSKPAAWHGNTGAQDPRPGFECLAQLLGSLRCHMSVLGQLVALNSLCAGRFHGDEGGEAGGTGGRAAQPPAWALAGEGALHGGSEPAAASWGR